MDWLVLAGVLASVASYAGAALLMLEAPAPMPWLRLVGAVLLALFGMALLYVSMQL